MADRERCNQGREQFNFSDLTSDDGPGPLIKRINNGSMPPPKYLALHPEARMDDKTKEAFIAGLRRTFGQTAP